MIYYICNVRRTETRVRKTKIEVRKTRKGIRKLKGSSWFLASSDKGKPAVTRGRPQKGTAARE